MENFILVVHVLIALVIIGLIMLQQGKGAEMGASFGSGSSQTVFGAVGTGNFFSRLTAVLVFIFFVTSFTLAVLAKQKSKIDEHFITPPIEAGQTVVAPSAESKTAELKTEAAPQPAAPAPTQPPAAENAAGTEEAK